MDFSLDSKYIDIQARTIELCKSIEHLAIEADDSTTIHPEIREALQTSGLTELMVPAAFGGVYDKVDPLAICVAREVMMPTCSHLDSLFAMQGIGSYGISVAGSDEQQQHWLPRVANAEVIPALAITEQDAGSDIRAVTTEIVAAADGFCLNGAKAFISNAGSASFYLTFVKEGSGFSLVLVPDDADGVETTPSPELAAPHVLGDVTFDNVLLPESARIGAAGDGMKHVLATLGVFRISVGGAAIGLAQAALEEAVRHTRTREQFGRPLNRLGPVAAMLADSWTEIEMARLLVYRAAMMARDEPPGSTLQHSSMAKLAASEIASKVVDRCVQMMGRFGLIRDSKIERLYRQSRPMRIYEGSSEVLRTGIARELDQVVS
jgi:acyl-CoA dehydrogenase